MKALSIRQPWAWLIVNGFKDIENRDWPTRFRGRFLVHAGKVMTRADYEACVIFTEAISDVVLPQADELERGGIVGAATVSGCVTGSRSLWFCGPFGFALKDARKVEFIPMKGALGFFEAGELGCALHSAGNFNHGLHG